MQFNPKPIDLKKLRSILGAPPLLSTENRESYDAMLFHYMDALKPQDFFLQMLVVGLVDADWESLRYKRHRAWSVERYDRRWREAQARLSKIAERKKSAEEDKKKPGSEGERLRELDLESLDLATQCVGLVDALDKPSTDVDMSRAMEKSISYYERLAKLENDCSARRVEIFEQIRLYDEHLYLKADRFAEYYRICETAELEAAAIRARALEEKNE